jgi:hypothetical protein
MTKNKNRRTIFLHVELTETTPPLWANLRRHGPGGGFFSPMQEIWDVTGRFRSQESADRRTIFSIGFDMALQINRIESGLNPDGTTK